MISFYMPSKTKIPYNTHCSRLNPLISIPICIVSGENFDFLLDFSYMKTKMLEIWLFYHFKGQNFSCIMYLTYTEKSTTMQFLKNYIVISKYSQFNISIIRLKDTTDSRQAIGHLPPEFTKLPSLFIKTTLFSFLEKVLLW